MNQNPRRSTSPRLTRSQIRQAINHIQAQAQVFAIERLLEFSKDQPSTERLRQLQEKVWDLQDEIAALERM